MSLYSIKKSIKGWKEAKEIGESFLFTMSYLCFTNNIMNGKACVTFQDCNKCKYKLSKSIEKVVRRFN